MLLGACCGCWTLLQLIELDELQQRSQRVVQHELFQQIQLTLTHQEL